MHLSKLGPTSHHPGIGGDLTTPCQRPWIQGNFHFQMSSNTPGATQDMVTMT